MMKKGLWLYIAIFIILANFKPLISNASYLDKQLIEAVRNGNISRVESLLDRGADVNVRAGYYGWTPLMVAVYYGHPDIAKLLIERGANVNARDRYGHTPLAFAKHHGKKEIIKLLENAGAR